MRRIRKYKKIFTQGWILLKYLYYKIYCIFNKDSLEEYKNCWLVSEHGNDARDNGYFFFEYVRENHPEIDIRYVITLDSPDFHKIENIGKYIIYGSKEHFLAFINSQLLISTHLSGCSPDVGLFFRLQRYGLLRYKGKNICLQHGIIHTNLQFFNQKNTNLSLLITSVQPEYNYLIKNNGFNSYVVKLTGLARYDNLKSKNSNQILFMPTFRKYMHYMNNSEFMKSDYYKHINSLINNIALINYLEANNLNLVFYIHSEFQKYLNLFTSNSKNIIIANMKDYEVQDLLINSKLLITDYSSVFFDFAYMKKPIIYYQFDYDTFQKRHYGKGYFSYTNDGFGPVCRREEEVVKSIKFYIKKGYKIEEKYRTRVSKFFIFNDNKNCERIFNEIIKLNNGDEL